MGDEKMQRTISAMVGKGSVNHNSRKFRAENVDGTRTHLNIDYCNENIKTVYHELFDEALERYNAKQIRSDRKIKDYYEKIRSSKQEKPFREIMAFSCFFSFCSCLLRSSSVIGSFFFSSTSSSSKKEAE